MRVHSGFSRTHKIGNIGIIANFVFPFICSKYDISCQWVQVDYISRLQTLLAYFISNGTAKTKLPILAFLYRGGFVKNPIEGGM